jgi:hypothetical protein
MDVQINELQSTVRAVDGDTLLSPTVMARIVRVVLQAVNDQEAHRERVHTEQRVTRGVSYELEEMD